MPNGPSAITDNCACGASGSAGASVISASVSSVVLNSSRVKPSLACASQGRWLQQVQRNWKLYFLRAPEVEFIDKGRASAPFRFGVKASILTTNGRAPGSCFVLDARALSGKPA